MNRLIQIVLICYVSLILINSLLLPPINFISIDNLLFPFAFVSVVYLYRKSSIFKWSGLIVILFITSNLISNYLSGGVTVQEVMWILRTVKLFTVGWSVFYLAKQHSFILKRLIFFSFLGFVIINALQLLEVQYVLDLYSSNQNNIDALNNSYLDGRIFGVSTNPNSNALIMALFGFYYFISEDKNKYYLMMLSGILILMTQSRTVFIAFVLTMLIAFLFKFIYKSRKHLLLFIGVTAVSFLVVFNLKLTNLSSLFSGSAYKSNSVTTRLDAINEVLNVNKTTPFFGKGKLNNIPELIGRSIDNEYMYVYLEYGLVGVLVLFLLILFLSILSLKVNRLNLGYLLIMGVCGLTNLTFSNIEVSALFILLFSASLLQTKHVNDQE